MLLTSVFLAGHAITRRAEAPWLKAVARVVFLTVLIRALNAFRSQFEILSTGHIRMWAGQAGYLTLAGTLMVLLFIAVRRFGLEGVTRMGARLLLVLAPFGLVNCIQGTWLAVKYGPSTNWEQPAAIFPAARNGTARVLWLIFDEMDERITFADRPAGLDLPELDRLQGEGLFATHAYPPAGHTTQSVPALLTGQLVAGVAMTGPAEQSLEIPALPSVVDWSSQPDVFRDALAEGFSTGLIGWCIPYCRIIGNHLNSCSWFPADQVADHRTLSVAGNMIRQDLALLYLAPFGGRRVTNWLDRTMIDYRVHQLATYEAMIDEAIALASSPRFDLSFIHMPVPHAPYIYDRRNQTTSATEASSYLDNLALADAALGRLRQAMEKSNIWERTTLIVSSDHWWRTDLLETRRFWDPDDAVIRSDRPDRRVPFIVRLAGQTGGATYEPEFNTVLTRDFIRAVMKGDVVLYEDAVKWLDDHRSIGESPYHLYDQ